MLCKIIIISNKKHANISTMLCLFVLLAQSSFNTQSSMHYFIENNPKKAIIHVPKIIMVTFVNILLE